MPQPSLYHLLDSYIYAMNQAFLEADPYYQRKLAPRLWYVNKFWHDLRAPLDHTHDKSSLTAEHIAGLENGRARIDGGHIFLIHVAAFQCHANKRYLDPASQGDFPLEWFQDFDSVKDAKTFFNPSDYDVELFVNNIFDTRNALATIHDQSHPHHAAMQAMYKPGYAPTPLTIVHYAKAIHTLSSAPDTPWTLARIREVALVALEDISFDHMNGIDARLQYNASAQQVAEARLQHILDLSKFPVRRHTDQELITLVQDELRFLDDLGTEDAAKAAYQVAEQAAQTKFQIAHAKWEGAWITLRREPKWLDFKPDTKKHPYQSHMLALSEALPKAIAADPKTRSQAASNTLLEVFYAMLALSLEPDHEALLDGKHITWSAESLPSPVDEYYHLLTHRLGINVEESMRYIKPNPKLVTELRYGLEYLQEPEVGGRPSIASLVGQTPDSATWVKS